MRPESALDSARAWPIGVAIVLFVVVVVQIVFATVAVQNADAVDPTYAAEAR